MNTDEEYMQRALNLAAKGLGTVSPNPLVGCVIIKDNKIIGEGYHKKYGEAHAEVNAVNAVQNPDELQGATAYVTLEPCAHFGKTPPCANLLIEKKIGKVVIAIPDPNPLVNSGGIAKLKAAGVAVKVGVLEEQARHQNRRFLTSFEKKRPYIILKWAETADGFIARENYDSKWISNSLSRKLVHKWRSEEDSILVGANTAVYDNPSLTVRNWPVQRHPLRVVAQRNRELPSSLKLYTDSFPTLFYRIGTTPMQTAKEEVMLNASQSFVEAMLRDLHQKKVQSVFVEGGATLLNHFIALNLWDEIRQFCATTHYFEGGISAPKVRGKRITQTRLHEDMLNVHLNTNN